MIGICRAGIRRYIRKDTWFGRFVDTVVIFARVYYGAVNEIKILLALQIFVFENAKKLLF